MFNTNKYRVYNWTHFMMIHWIINPGLAFNELVLGQRVPKVMLEDKTSAAPRAQRSVIPCPHCNTLHNGETWSVQNNTAYKNWFGLYCPACSNIIPCLTNAFSFIILAVTFPIWGWFRKSLKEHWLKKQPERYKNIQTISPATKYRHWFIEGMLFGILMFLFMEVLFPLIEGEEITLKKGLLRILIWLAGGMLFGYINKSYITYKGKPQTKRLQ